MTALSGPTSFWLLRLALPVAMLIGLSATGAWAGQIEFNQCIKTCNGDAIIPSCGPNCEHHLRSPRSAPMPAAPRVFGAIAIDQASLIAGSWKGAPSRAVAEEQALAQCRKAGGSTRGCKVVGWAHNSCVALAASRQGPPNGNTWATAFSDDGWVARRDALKLCRKEGGADCKVSLSFCTG